MIEGTKPFRRKAEGEKNPNSSTTNERTAASAAPTADAANVAPQQDKNSLALGRRDWFRALVPAFGSGLVEILRTSNHLQHEWRERVASEPDKKSD